MKKVPVTTVEGLYKLTPLAVLTETEDINYAAEIKGADDRSFFLIDNSQGDETVSVSVAPGDYSAGGKRELGTVASGETALLYLDSAFCKTAEGIHLSLNPNGIGTKISAVEFLPVTNN